MSLIEEEKMLKNTLKLLIFCLAIQTSAKGLSAFDAKSFFPKKVVSRIESLSKSNKTNNTAGRAQYVKELYYSVNGYPSDFDSSMSPEPHLEFFNSVVGGGGVGGVLYSSGYETCDAIPDSGTASGSVPRIGTLNLTFGSASKSVPAYYPTDSSSDMDKKITVDSGGFVDITLELKCNDDLSIQTGYVKLDYTSYDIVYEGYFQQNTTTGAVNLDMYIKTETGGGTELLIPTQFSTEDGESYTMYSGYIYPNGGGGSDYVVAVNGETNGKAQMAFLSTSATSGTEITTAPNNFGSVGGATVECIDVPTEVVTTGCSSIPAPGTISIGGTSSTWTVSSLRNVSL